jgi:hypothetical protein
MAEGSQSKGDNQNIRHVVNMHLAKKKGVILKIKSILSKQRATIRTY